MDGITAGKYKKRSSKTKINGARTGKKKLRFSPVKAAKNLVAITLMGLVLANAAPPVYAYARDSFIASEKQQIKDSYINQLKNLSAWAPGSNKEVKQLTNELTKGIGHNPLNNVIASTHYVTYDGKFESKYSKTEEISKNTVNELSQQNVGFYGEVRSFKDTDDWKNSGQIVHNLINDKKKTNQFIGDIKKFVSEKNLKGFSIDFEGVWLEDREKFVEFVGQVKNELGMGVNLSVAVPVQFNENMNPGYDYNGIAKNCDEVKLMNYQIDKGQLTADEGKIWQHISSVVENPSDAKKFSDGLPLFAEIDGGKGVRYPFAYSMEKVAKQKADEVQRDKSGDAHFVYNSDKFGETKAIVMDSKAVELKMQNLNGMSEICLYDLSYAADSNGKLADVVVDTVNTIESYNKQIIEKKKEEYRKEHPFKTATKDLIEAKTSVDTAKALFEGGKATVIGGISAGKDVIDLLR